MSRHSDDLGKRTWNLATTNNTPTYHQHKTIRPTPAPQMIMLSKTNHYCEKNVERENGKEKRKNKFIEARAYTQTP